MTSPAPTVLVAHPGAELYGSDRVLLDTVDQLVRRGWVVVVTLPGDGPLVELLRRVGARVEVLPTPVVRKAILRPRGALRFLATALRSLVPSMRLLRGADPSVVYVSTVTVPHWVALARLRRRPVVVHLHEAEVDGPRAVRRLLALPQLLAARVVANSRFSASVLVDLVPRLAGRCTVVTNPVPGPPGGPSAPRPELDAPVRLLYVGRLSPRKGPQHAVAALARLGERGIEARLRLLGGVFPGYEWFDEELRGEIARLGLGDRVELLGFRDDVWPQLAEADVVVVPSVAPEPFGNTAVEAALAARPVVVSDIGGLPEAIQGLASARAVASEDPEALAGAIAEVVAQWPTVLDAAVRDADIAADRHGPDRYGGRIDEVLREAAGHEVHATMEVLR